MIDFNNSIIDNPSLSARFTFHFG